MSVAVIGSGPTGALAAHALARSGVPVDLLDGGETHESPRIVAEIAETVRGGRAPTPEQMRWLRRGPDGAGLIELLGRALSVLRGRVDPRELEKRIAGSSFVFRGADRSADLEGGWLPRSAAVGGLANAWGAACYTLRPEDYRDWPFDASALRDHFRRASEAVGVTGEADGLEDVYPALADLGPVTGGATRDPDSAFETLLPRWRGHREPLEAAGIRAGRSRLAVRPPGAGPRDCVRCGLCTFGCPTGAIWNPGVLLAETAGPLHHLPGRLVRQIRRGDGGLRLRGRTGGGEPFDLGPYEAVFLAAGALGSARIAAHSLGAHGARVTLLENDMFVIPLRIDRSVSRGRGPVRFSLSEAAWAFDPGVVSTRSAHMQFYRLTEPLLGPLGQLIGRLPGPALRLAERRLAGFALGFLYLHSVDSRSIRIRVDIERDRLAVDADTAPADPAAAARAIERIRRVAPQTGLRPLGRLARVAPPGFSAHLGGTLPMTSTDTLMTTRVDGSLCGMEDVYVVDLSTLPAVPAQNATLTGMANALRVVERFLQKRAAP